MKKFLSLLMISMLIPACSHDSEKRNKNPYIPSYGFSINLDTNLPSYSPLAIPLNPIIVTTGGTGVSGIIVMKISDGDYRAWEAACPNQYPASCSTLKISGATNAKCDCENFTYSLFTGVGSGQYTMIPYHVQVSGTVVKVSN